MFQQTFAGSNILIIIGSVDVQADHQNESGINHRWPCLRGERVWLGVGAGAWVSCPRS
jgi:hypothetical protein